MALRFSKRIKLMPGLTLNISKGGLSISAGPKGAKITVDSKGGVRKTVGIPGSGIYHTTYKKPGNNKEKASALETVNTASSNKNSANPLWILLAIAVIILVLRLTR